MTDDESHEAEYGLVMPFVTVASKGGPHDDESYAAGFECGQMNSRLAAIAAMEVGTARFDATIRTVNLDQHDLIAMRHGFTMERLPAAPDAEVEGWAFVRFAQTGGTP